MASGQTKSPGTTKTEGTPKCLGEVTARDGKLRSPVPLGHRERGWRGCGGSCWWPSFPCPLQIPVTASCMQHSCKKKKAIFIGCTKNSQFWSEKRGQRQTFNSPSVCTAMEMTIFLSAVLAAVVWIHDPASHMHSSSMNIPKR